MAGEGRRSYDKSKTKTQMVTAPSKCLITMHSLYSVNLQGDEVMKSGWLGVSTLERDKQTEISV